MAPRTIAWTTVVAFAEGSYETVDSRIEAGGGEKVVETAVRLLNQLKLGV